MLAEVVEETTLQALRGWLAAVGSFGALAVAIYVGVLVGALRRPSLSLHFTTVPMVGDAVVVGTFLYREEERVGHTDAAYLRLRVGNAPRRHTAEDVEVLILAMDRVDKTEPSPNLGDFPLAWSNSAPVTTTRNIPAGVERHIDLLHVLEEHPYGPARRLAMDVYPAPTDGRQHLEPGKYLIALAITALNADARHYKLVLEYDGGWEPDIWDRLQVLEGPMPLGEPLSAGR